MGTGSGRGLDFGLTLGALRASQDLDELPSSIPESDFTIGRSLSARALNYDVSDPKTGKIYHFIEGTTITQVEVFAGKGTRNKLSPKVARGLSEQVGGSPRDWKHVKGIGSLDFNGRARKAEVHWFEAAGQPKVKFKVKEWLE